MNMIGRMSGDCVLTACQSNNQDKRNKLKIHDNNDSNAGVAVYR